MLKRHPLSVAILGFSFLVLLVFSKSVTFSKPGRSPLTFSLGPSGDYLQTSTTLVVATHLTNTGSMPALGVTVQSITLGSAPLLSPPLPLSVGPLGPGQTATIQATFDSTSLVQGQSYDLVIAGTYLGGVAPYARSTSPFSASDSITLPPVSPGSAPVNTITVGSQTVTGAPFPHQPPNFPDDVNGPHWLVPTGPFVSGTPTPNGTMTTPAPGGSSPAQQVSFNANNGMGLTNNISGTAEPSGGVSVKPSVVFASANWTAAYSTNGVNFTPVDPTTVFPKDAVGFCCDQVVQFVPSIDRFIWLLQGNGYRLAAASPSDIINFGGTAWTYWNLTPSVFGQPTENFDYPDLSVGDNYLYISWDAGGPKGCDCGHQVVRTSLAGIQAGGTISIDYTDPKNGGSSWGSHLMQDTGNEIFWAGQDNSSQMRIFSLMEGSNTYYWQTLGVATWANNSPLKSLTPDGQNWIDFLMNPTKQNPGGGFPNNSAIGATRSGRQIWFAWSAGTDNNFPKPHIEMVAITADQNQPPDLNLSQQVQVWNSGFAFAYPALATNACTGEIGMSLETGGGGNYENHGVGFWGDFTVYVTTNSDVGSTRFGDYVSIRQDHTPGNNNAYFDAFGYGLNSSGTDVHYVQFGRSGGCDQR